MNTVHIFDTTLRDGEQSPGFSMNVEEKLHLATQLEQLGVDVIEAGFPIASRGDLEAVRAVAQQVRNCQVAGLARARKVRYGRAHAEDVEFSAEDASRSDRNFLGEALATAAAAGATTLNIPDTVGYAVPEEYAA